MPRNPFTLFFFIPTFCIPASYPNYTKPDMKAIILKQLSTKQPSIKNSQAFLHVTNQDHKIGSTNSQYIRKLLKDYEQSMKNFAGSSQHAENMKDACFSLPRRVTEMKKAGNTYRVFFLKCLILGQKNGHFW